jgi:hypothetical protein
MSFESLIDSAIGSAKSILDSTVTTTTPPALATTFISYSYCTEAFW